MPLGWYLAQGLIPLGPSSSDDEEGPCELPNGRLVCGPHGLVVCGKCCSDYSFMEDVLSNDEDEDGHFVEDERMRNMMRAAGLGGFADDSGGDEEMDAATEAMYWDLDPEARAEIDGRWGPPPPRQFSDAHARQILATLRQETLPQPFAPAKTRGTGRVFATKFSPPNGVVKPAELLPATTTDDQGVRRYTHRNDPKKVLVFTDGACLNNGQENPKAGCGVNHGPGTAGVPSLWTGRLESQGPFGDASAQTSNRAELRAVIAALRSYDWRRHRYHTIVIATDSEYAVDGATKWVKTWARGGWMTSGGKDVKNKDLWEMLLGDVDRWDRQGLTVHLWRIPREWNTAADAAAKEAASREEVPAEWKDN
ncbi:hypothetical protein LQW54_001489 [Pestalotiopsis sp. IQ-011]